VLPHAAAYNAPAAPAAMQAAGRALGAVDVPLALHALLLDVAHGAGTPTSLAELGLREADLARAAEIACARPYPNPRPPHVDGVRALLARAHAGVPPVIDG
jgi:alcohol dehydrogenase class IV